MIEGSQEQPHHGGIDTAQRRLKAGPRAKRVPKRQGTDDEQKGGCKHGDERQGRSGHAASERLHHRPQVRGKGEERAGDGLRRPVPGDELLVGDPSRRHHLCLEQWQDHMPTAEHQRAHTEETIEDRQRLTLDPLLTDR